MLIARFARPAHLPYLFGAASILLTIGIAMAFA